MQQSHRMSLKHALGDVDSDEMYVCHFRPSCFRADHGATIAVVNRQEGHPIHQLSLPTEDSSAGLPSGCIRYPIL